MSRGKKYKFNLNNVDFESILFEYTDNKEGSDIIETVIENFNENSQFTNRDGKRTKKHFVILSDQYKNASKYWVNMLDYTQNGCLPPYTSKPCWWCRSSFKTHPIGCPIKYHKPTTDIDKERLSLNLKYFNLQLDKDEDFFETEGLFCSFSCVKAYILDELSKSQSGKYKNSLTLLSLLHEKMCGSIHIIKKAPTWKVLKDYGGHLTPDQYRENFNSFNYQESVNIRRPYMFSTSKYILEKKIK